jgi:hypothetical protein
MMIAGVLFAIHGLTHQQQILFFTGLVLIPASRRKRGCSYRRGLASSAGSGPPGWLPQLLQLIVIHNILHNIISMLIYLHTTPPLPKPLTFP